MSLLLHNFKAKPRINVNNKDIIQIITWDITGLVPERLYQSLFQ